ncbi:MAG: hypothetical protein RLZZ437_3392 [Pseudomonadota bacterium]|jgi:transposase
MGNGNRPTPEFRREAVRLALTSGRTRREIAEDLGIGLSTLTRWLRDERDASEPSEAPVDVHAELKRLRRENAVLKQERDILKNCHGSQPACARYKQLVLPSVVWRAVADRLLEGQTPLKNVANGLMRT